MNVVPHPRLAVHRNGAPTLLDDAKHGGQPKPRALANVLRRKEGLEDPCLRDRIHADTRVRDRQQNMRSGGEANMLGGHGRLDVHVGGLNPQPAAIRHGVARVRGEVHQDLLQLRRIDLDGAQVGRGGEGKLHVGAEEATEQGLHSAEQGIDVDDPGNQCLLPTER